MEYYKLKNGNDSNCKLMIDKENFYSKPIHLQVAEITNVYEEVNEKEYCRRRQDRIEDDWIVDDGKLF